MKKAGSEKRICKTCGKEETRGSLQQAITGENGVYSGKLHVQRRHHDEIARMTTAIPLTQNLFLQQVMTGENGKLRHLQQVISRVSKSVHVKVCGGNRRR